MKIIIASTNPVKINAVKNAFYKTFPKKNFEFIGTKTNSKVSDQPINNQETLQGAYNRVNNIQNTYPDADFRVGIEGGLEKTNDDMEVFARIVIKNKNKIGKSKTATFFLPKKIIKLINDGKELGEADDIVFGHNNSKQKNGAVGILSKNLITRESYYTEAIILALIPTINPQLY